MKQTHMHPVALANATPAGTTAGRQIRAYCHGEPPLEARLEPWQIQAMQNPSLPTWIERYSSPLNLLSTAPFTRNLAELNEVAGSQRLDFQVYFARKANKCLAFVDAAAAAGAGIDVASEVELQQVLQRGVPGCNIICTAAVKSASLITTCVVNQVVIAVDNEDEIKLLRSVIQQQRVPVRIALRVSGFQHEGEKLFSRFGFDIDAIDAVVQQYFASPATDNLQIAGLHFHLDGYCSGQRASAIRQCLELVDRLRTAGHNPAFVDIGGGLPMCYLQDESAWNAFWQQHGEAVLGRREPLTYRNHGLGFIQVDGKLHGKRNCYPYFQHLVRAGWLQKVLDSPAGAGTIAAGIRQRNLQLRCEPGRSVLDGCGMTVATVEFCKQHPSGEQFIGLAMNRTQCRTSSDDFLVDPIVIPQGGDRPAASEGYLVGAYCTESELILLRKLRFPAGIARGDLVVLPNTAGYLMHFLESRSHQFPLAKNLVLEEDATPRLDAIDL